MAKAKVVFVTTLTDEMNNQVVGYAPEGFATTILPNRVGDEEKIEALKDADFILTFGGTFSERVLQSAPKLKLIQYQTAGHNVNLKFLEELGLSCATDGGANSGAVADHAVLLMLALYRKLTLADAAVRAGGWRFESPATDLNTYFEMAGKLVGVVGMGNIGQQVAKRLLGFGCKVHYSKRQRLPPERESELNIVYATLHELLSAADIVTLHVPFTSETALMIGKEELGLLKPSTILVNTSRGQVVDEAALIAALQQGRIAGAGLDVFQKEPPDPENPLLTMDNVIVTPHLGGGTRDSWIRAIEFSYQNIKAVWEGKPPQAVVTAEGS